MRRHRRSDGFHWRTFLVASCCAALLGATVGSASLPLVAASVEEQAEESAASSSSLQSQFQILEANLLPKLIIGTASEVLRSQIVQAMEQAASLFGFALDNGDWAYICRDDLIIINCSVSGSETVALNSGDVSIPVGLFYVSHEGTIRFGDGEHGRRPPGFYAVRLASGPAARETVHDPGIALLELVGDSAGPGLTLPTELLPPTSTARVTACLDVGSDGQDSVCLGWSGADFSVRICFTLTPDA